MQDTFASTSLAQTHHHHACVRKRHAALVSRLPLIVLLLVLGVALTVPGHTRHAQPTLPGQRITIKVAAHETLWRIAQQHPVPGYTTAETVEAIRQANGLTTSALAQDQLLEVPTSDSIPAVLASR